MSKVAEWMREKYVEPQVQAFSFQHGRWPTSKEEKPMWDRAFEMAKLDSSINKLDLD